MIDWWFYRNTSGEYWELMSRFQTGMSGFIVIEIMVVGDSLSVTIPNRTFDFKKTEITFAGELARSLGLTVGSLKDGFYKPSQEGYGFDYEG